MKACFLVLLFLFVWFWGEKKKKKDSSESHTWYVHRAAFAYFTTTELSILIQEMQKITEQFENKNHKQTELAILKFQSSINGNEAEKSHE